MNKKTITDEINALGFKFRDAEKKAFLHNLNKYGKAKTTKAYMSVLSKTIDDAERINDREWMDFSESMVNDALILVEAKPVATLQSYLSIIKDYLSSTTPYSDTLQIGYNYTLSMTKDDLKDFVNAIGNEKMYVTPREFDEIIFDRPGDPMSKSIFILLYHGVKGLLYKDIYEMQVKDINLITGVVTKDGEFVCAVEEKYLDILKECIEATTFKAYDNNGNIIKESPLTDNSIYLVRRSESPRHDSSVAPDTALISNRLGALLKSIRNQYLTAPTRERVGFQNNR